MTIVDLLNAFNGLEIVGLPLHLFVFLLFTFYLP